MNRSEVTLIRQVWYTDSHTRISVMYQPIRNLTIPRATPGDSHVLTARGAGVLNQRSFYSSERKMQDLLDLCQETAAEQVLLRCFISIFAKTVDVYCIFTRWNIFGHFGHLDKT